MSLIIVLDWFSVVWSALGMGKRFCGQLSMFVDYEKVCMCDGFCVFGGVCLGAEQGDRDAREIAGGDC